MKTNDLKAADLLILRAPTLDAAAGMCQLLYEHPRAEVREHNVGDIFDWPEDRPMWVLGLRAKTKDDGRAVIASPIDLTPAASIGMQVWHLLHDDESPGEPGTLKPVPPWWLCHLDDVLCNRVHDTTEGGALVAYLQSFRLDKVPWNSLMATKRGSESGVAIIKAGRAVLRSQKRLDERRELECNSLRRERDQWHADAVRLHEERDVLRADVKAAAGELLLPIPEPGSDMARLMIVNRLLRNDRDEFGDAMHAAMENLGVPGEGYPAPVAEAYRILDAALREPAKAEAKPNAILEQYRQEGVIL